MGESHFNYLQAFKKVKKERHQREDEYRDMMGHVYIPETDKMYQRRLKNNEVMSSFEELNWIKVK